jgi:rare lipoprotein A
VGTRQDTPQPPTVSKAPSATTTTRPGGYYLDDGPGDQSPASFDSIPEPTPRIEALHRGAARPYVAMGRSYTPMTSIAPYKAQGLATWYGRRYHGKPTSIGEAYDMYAITAAHPTLPLPSYARVTHLKTGKSIVVRVNDRGPFHEGRIIDLSYTAAHRLGILAGATMVEVEGIIPEGGTTVTVVPSQPQYAPPAAPAFATPTPDGPRPASAENRFPVMAAEAAAEPQAAASGPQLPVTTEGGRVYLQLGAFGSRENAESYLARLKSQAEWLSLQVFSRDGLFRVQAGPYTNQNEARQSAERLSQALGVRPVVITR